MSREPTAYNLEIEGLVSHKHKLEAEVARLRAPRFEVVQLQPDDDCPGLWIGFKTGKDRDEAMKLFALETKP